MFISPPGLYCFDALVRADAVTGTAAGAGKEDVAIV